MTTHSGLSGHFSQASTGQASGGGVGFDVQGLTDPNAEAPLDKKTADADVNAWDPRMAASQDPVVSVAAVFVDPPKPEPLPAAELSPAQGIAEPVAEDTPVPTVDTLDAVKEAGQVDNHLGQKVEKLQDVAGAQNERMDELKANMDSITKPAGADPKAQTGVNLGEPSAFRNTLGLALPSPAGVVVAGAAGVAFGPGAAAAVAAVDTGLNVLSVFRSTSPAADVALKGQGTYSDAKTDTRIPQYGYKGKPQSIEAYTYGSSAKSIESVARPASAPIVVDTGLGNGPRRLSADDLWKTGQLANSDIKLGPQATKEAADQMAQLRTEMEKTGVYADKLKRFAETPLDLNRDNLTKAVTSGTELKMEDLENRRVFQVRPPDMNVHLRLG